MLRPALDAGAGVEQHGRAACASGWSSPAPDDRRRAACPNAPCAAITVAPVWPALKSAAASPSRDRFGGDPDRRARLAPQRRGRRLVHADRFGRVDDADVERGRRAGCRASSRSIAARDRRRAAARSADAAPRRARRRRCCRGPSSPPIASMAMRINQLPGSHLPFHQVRIRVRDAHADDRRTLSWNLEPGNSEPELILRRPAGPGGPCSSRSARRRGAAPSPRGTADSRRPAPAQRVVRAALGRAGLRMSAFWIRHVLSSPSLGSADP